MAYGSFAKWYVAKLKAKPFLVNVSSGFLLMSTGDVLAQTVEDRAAAASKSSSGETEIRNQQPEREQKHSETEPASSAAVARFLREATDGFYRAIQEETSLDTTRTAKMAAWSIVFAPFYVGIFKLYDRYLPKKNLPSIAARVGCSFLSSIPINFAFYAYGNFVEHTAEWYRERCHDENNNNSRGVVVPYRFDRLVEKTRRKLEAEFLTTIRTSATFWIPLNFLSFSVVPSHIQPLNLMFFSVFWNCYLSMSQHREVGGVE